MNHTEQWAESCPHGGQLAGGVCTGQAGDCTFRYTAQKSVTVQVAVDGATAFNPNQTFGHTTHQAGTPSTDLSTCPTPPPPIIPQGGRCPFGWHFYTYLTADGVTWAEACVPNVNVPVN